MKRYSTILILIALLIAGAACGKLKFEGDDIYADYMVNQRDAERIFGEPMRLVVLKKNSENNVCVYESASADGGKSLETSFQTAPDLETLIAADELAKKAAARFGAKVETVENIGDAAWLRTDEYGQRLYVRKNLVSFIITFSGDMSKGAGFDGIKSLSREIAEML